MEINCIPLPKSKSPHSLYLSPLERRFLFSVDPTPPEPCPDHAIPSPLLVPHPFQYFPSTPHVTYISSSPHSPGYLSCVLVRKVSPLHLFPSSLSPKSKIDIKGKAPATTITPHISPGSSPNNLFDDDLDILLKRNSLYLRPLSISKPHKSTSPSISPNSSANITVRRT